MAFELGVAAALAAPLVMTVGFILWEHHWCGRGSAFALNLFKCCLATVAFALVVLATHYTDDSNDDNNNNKLFANWKAQPVGYLLLSSTIGILIGDWTWLQGLKLLGAKRVILMDSFKPFLAAFLGWIILKEKLRLSALSGICLTVVGVLLVSWEETASEEEKQAAKAGGANNNITQREQEDAFTESNAVNEVTAPLSEFAEMNIEKDPSAADPTRRVKNEAELLPDSLSACTNTKEEASLSSTENENTQQQYNKLTWYGYAMSILNVGLDTYGALLIKEHGKDLSVWEINLIRFGFAAIVMLFVSLSLHAWSWWRQRCRSSCSEEVKNAPKSEVVVDTNNDETAQGDKDNNKQDIQSKQSSVAWYSLPKLPLSSWCHIVGGVLLVTFLTPTLSNYAIFQIALALALTLGSVGPLYALALGYCLQGHKLTLRGVLGAMLAVAGIVVLAFRGNLPEEENVENEAL